MCWISTATRPRLAIEVAGGQHSEPDKERRDTERTAYLGRQGITVIRFWNHEVLQETEAVLEQLYEALTPALTPALSQREREEEGVTPFPRGWGRGGRTAPRSAGTAAADLSIARSGETLRQSDWRDECSRPAFAARPGSASRSRGWNRCRQPAGCTPRARRARRRRGRPRA